MGVATCKSLWEANVNGLSWFGLSFLYRSIIFVVCWLLFSCECCLPGGRIGKESQNRKMSFKNILWRLFTQLWDSQPIQLGLA